jgi:N-acetylmuramoyl-L-alanine amidase
MKAIVSNQRTLAAAALAFCLFAAPNRALAVAPDAPTLVSPANGSNVAGGVMPFRWTQAANATNYYLDVATDPSFGNRVFGQWIGNYVGANLGGFPDNGQSYYWRVAAGNTDGASDFSNAWLVVNGPSAPPAVPTLVSPANGVNVGGTTIHLQWNRAARANDYHLQIATDQDFGNLVYSEWIGSYLGMELSGFPDNGTQYFWRVAAGNALGTSDHSNGWAVVNGPSAPPAVPTLVSPANGANVGGTTIHLQWNRAARASDYHLQIATDQDFGNLVYSEWIGSYLGMELSGFPDNGTQYFWRVGAGNALGTSDHSNGWAVVNGPSAQPAAPALVSPANGTNVGGTTILLQWDRAARASDYHLQIATDQDFGNLVYSEWIGNYLGMELSGFPDNGTEFHWRAKARNALGEGALSDAWMFTNGRARLVMVDPGHGGNDTGAVGCELRESDMNLDTSLRLRNLLVAAGYIVFMTRETDVFVGLRDRADLANNLDIDRFVSVHHNAFNSNATGTETLIYTNPSADSVDLANRVQQAMVDAWGLTDRGVKRRDLVVLRATTMPAVLSESGFLDNCAVDARIIAQPAQRQVAAVAHRDAINGHFARELSVLDEAYASTQNKAPRSIPKDVDVPEFDMAASEDEPLASLYAERVIAEDDYMQPVISPSGDYVLFTKPGFATLYVGSVKDGSVRILKRGRRVGYDPVWQADSAAVGIRTKTGGRTEVLQYVDLHGAAVESPQESQKPRVLDDNGKIYVLEGSDRHLISRGSDRFFAPQLSPDHRFVVFRGVSTGVYAYRMEDQKLFHFGRGHRLSFSGNGRYLVFDRSVDDGHRILAGDLYIADLTTPTPRIGPLTQTEARIEAFPSLNATGDLVAFSSSGKILVARVAMH